MNNINEQGQNSETVFHGNGQQKSIYEFYGKSASLFANTIHTNLPAGDYVLADLGGHKGELLGDILNLLPEYNFDSIIIDKVEGLDLKVKTRKIIGDIIDSKIPDKSIDVVIVRYVLPWDKFENQKLILKEIKRICRGIAIIQHQGAPNDNPKPLQDASIKLWGGSVPVLKRNYGFFTEAKKIEEWMNELQIKFNKIDEKYIETLSGLFSENFGLSPADTKMTEDILSGCDGITVTTWLLRF